MSPVFSVTKRRLRSGCKKNFSPCSFFLESKNIAGKFVDLCGLSETGGVQSRCVTLCCVSLAQDCSADEHTRLCTQVTSVSLLVCCDTCQITKQFSVFFLDQLTSQDLIFNMAMQDVINKMKGTALGVAEYLTPVLKVRSCPSLEFRFFVWKAVRTGIDLLFSCF